VTYDVPGFAMNREIWEVVQVALLYAVRHQPLVQTVLGA